MSNLAYVRTSCVEQNEVRQVEALKKYDIDKWFIEKKSGKNMEREELNKLLDYAREGDIIYIHDLTRLARNLKNLLEIIDKLKEKKIDLVSNKENIDTKTPMGKLMLHLVGAIAEFERENLLERQAEGIQQGKLRGVYKGRKRIQKPKDWDEVYSEYERREITAKEAMKKMGLKKNTFYNMKNNIK
ncbi:MAG TPA: resolvase [Clostridiales bacterium]|nr:MAG: resolvase [Clostridiales bacterium GWD2_32_59]HAN10520.1 resolvase [Clostridiales bacterium]